MNFEPYMVSTVATNVGEFRIAVGCDRKEGTFCAVLDYADASQDALISEKSSRVELQADSLWDLVDQVEAVVGKLGGRITDRGGFPDSTEINHT